MIEFNKETQDKLINLLKDKKVGLEGNILKLIKTNSEEFKEYIQNCLEKDTSNRQKRLNLTKQIQQQNKDLISWKDENLIIQDL
jgi:hypothetical protein